VVSNVLKAQEYLQDVAQGVLNSKTGEVITGITSRQAAVRSAVKQLADEGITGFVDKAGRSWTPEAYVNMDIRTTSGNVAKEAVFQQCEESGLDLVIVPVNATARPGCAPYQGKVLSRSGASGKTTDRSGNSINYSPLSGTTYGEPDGLFGINCHHSPPDPFIPGMSKQKDKPEPDVAENYEKQQKQRYFENEVKKSKREAALYNASGDKEAFEKAAKKVKEKTATLKAYTDKEGLTYHNDRVQVYGYGRSEAAKVKQAK
jgi:nitrogen regulatory protein PII-like uncharacterized protein